MKTLKGIVDIVLTSEELATSTLTAYHEFQEVLKTHGVALEHLALVVDDSPTPYLEQLEKYENQVPSSVIDAYTTFEIDFFEQTGIHIYLRYRESVTERKETKDGNAYYCLDFWETVEETTEVQYLDEIHVQPKLHAFAVSQ